jgi:hypothetical protein
MILCAELGAGQIHQRARRVRQFAEIIGVGIRYGPSRAAQRCDGAKTVGVAIASSATAQHAIAPGCPQGHQATAPRHSQET